MAVKKRDFQKIASLIQEFLSKLSCEESTAELRDSLNLALFNLQKYYKTLRGRCQSLSNGLCSSNASAKFLGGSLVLCKSNGVVSPISPACSSHDIFEWKWYNLDSPRLCASLGTDEFSSLSPVFQLSKDGNKELLKELVNKDPAVVHQVDSLGRDAVMYAVHGNTAAHTECLELLLKTNCNVDHQANDDSTSLHLAAHNGNSAALLLLLKSKASVNIADCEGRTSLHWAAASSSTENLKMLLQFGGNMSATDREGLTPSMWACHFDQLENLRVLRSALARMDPRDDALFDETDCCGKTIIHWAVNRMASTKCLKELLTEETVLMRTKEGKSVIHVATEEGSIPACKLALDVRGAEGLNDRDHKMRTPLHVATLCAHGEMINFLLEKGADITAVDADGLTPLDYVKSHQLYYCAMIFSLYLQYQKLHSEPPEPDSAVFVKSSRENIISESKDERIPEADEHIIRPSAPPFIDIIDQLEEEPPPESPKILPNDNIDVTDYDGFEIEEEEEDLNGEPHQVSRRHSVPATLAPPRISPRRKNSEPPPVNMVPVLIEEEQDQSCGETVNEEKERIEKHESEPRKQSILKRQGGLSHDSEEHLNANSLDGPTFDMRTEGGETLVVLGSFENEENGFDLEIDCGDNEMELSSAKLNQGHGSPSSVHSEPYGADGCSASFGISVSSIGSDYEESQQETAEGIINQRDIYEESGRQSKVEGRRCYVENEKHSRDVEKQKEDDQVTKGKKVTIRNRMQTNEVPKAVNTTELPLSQMTYYEKPSNVKVPVTPDKDVQEDNQNGKKKNNKKKKSQKGALNSGGQLMPRGLTAPLEPPQFGPSVSKFGNHFTAKLGPGELSSLGVRKGASAPRNTTEHSQQRHSYGAPEYVRGSFGSTESSFDQLDMNSGAAYGRPVTPEPSQETPRDMMGRALQPAPPATGYSSYSRPMDGITVERDSVYGPPGPMHGPLAQSRGQALLRNTDFVRGPAMNLDPRAQAIKRSRGPQGIPVHGGVQSPHPPWHH